MGLQREPGLLSDQNDYKHLCKLPVKKQRCSYRTFDLGLVVAGTTWRRRGAGGATVVAEEDGLALPSCCDCGKGCLGKIRGGIWFL